MTQSGDERVGKLLDKGTLDRIPNNPIYVGRISQKGICYPGEHGSIVTLPQWDAAQKALVGQQIEWHAQGADLHGGRSCDDAARDERA